MRQMGGEQGEFAAGAMNMYITLFEAAQREVSLVGLALEIDEDRTATLMEFAEFTTGGEWAAWAKDVEEGDDQLAGLPAGPYVAAFSAMMPSHGFEGLMGFSAQMMKQLPQGKLTDEQVEKYVKISSDSMKGIESMRMLMGVPQPGEGLYGGTIALMEVKDSKQFITSYKQTMAEMKTLAEETQSPMIPKMESQDIEIAGVDGLELTMNMGDLAKTLPGGDVAGSQKMMGLMMGSDGALKIYMAPLDETTVAFAYTSRQRIEAMLNNDDSESDPLAEDEGIATVAEYLPEEAQAVVYVSLRGMGQAVKNLAPETAGGPGILLQNVAECPPIGMAAYVYPTGAEGYVVVSAETLKAIGEVAAKARVR
jgi:hypothetical protein